MMQIAVYPGSFDPITNGHLDIIQRSARLFDRVIVAVEDQPKKKPLFSSAERVKMIKMVTADIPNVAAESYDGPLIDYVRSKGASIVVRGIRTISEFDLESQLALAFEKLDCNIKMLFMMTSLEYSYVSSSIVKEIASYGGCTSSLVFPSVEEKLRHKYKELKAQ